MSEYKQALAFYCQSGLFDRICFCENSGEDLGPLRETGGSPVELLTFDGLNYPPSYGKAYGEFKL